MAYIYKITNQLNQKSYIGKTEKQNPRERFNEHIRQSKKRSMECRPLYAAFNKYGIENFIFEVLEETDNPIDREKFYIDFYNSYGSTGYNATRGGDGRPFLNEEQILEDYNKYQNISKTAKINNCAYSSVVDILKKNNVKKADRLDVIKKIHSKTILMLDKNNEEILMVFNSYNEAGRYLLDNNLSNMTKVAHAADKVSLVCRGKRKTFANFKWRLLV